MSLNLAWPHLQPPSDAAARSACGISSCTGTLHVGSAAGGVQPLTLAAGIKAAYMECSDTQTLLLDTTASEHAVLAGWQAKLQKAVAAPQAQGRASKHKGDQRCAAVQAQSQAGRHAAHAPPVQTCHDDTDQAAQTDKSELVPAKAAALQPHGDVTPDAQQGGVAATASACHRSAQPVRHATVSVNQGAAASACEERPGATTAVLAGATGHHKQQPKGADELRGMAGGHTNAEQRAAQLARAAQQAAQAPEAAGSVSRASHADILVILQQAGLSHQDAQGARWTCWAKDWTGQHAQLLSVLQADAHSSLQGTFPVAARAKGFGACAIGVPSSEHWRPA